MIISNYDLLPGLDHLSFNFFRIIELYLVSANISSLVVHSEGAITIVPDVDGNISAHLIAKSHLNIPCTTSRSLETLNLVISLKHNKVERRTFTYSF